MSSRAPATTAHPAGDGESEDPDDGLIFDELSDPSDEEICAQLAKPAIGGPVNEKKTYLQKKVMPHRETILKKLTEISPPASNQLALCLNANALKGRSKANDIAKVLLGTERGLSILVALSNAQTRQSRADKDLIETIIAPMKDHLTGMVAAATQAANQEKMDQHRKSIVKLSAEELNRKYLAGGGCLSDDSSWRICPRCGCESIDCPPTNPARIQMNAENLQRYQAELLEYNARKAESGGNGATRVGYRGDTSCRAPQKPKLLDAYLQCHCHQSRNPKPTDPDNAGSTCLIKCRDKHGQSYGVDPVTGKTLCPSCNCPCMVAIRVSGSWIFNIRPLFLKEVSHLLILVVSA